MDETRNAFTDADAAAAWDEGAAAWDAFVESGADYYRHEVHGPALVAAIGPVSAKRVLDVGCGQGFFSRELAKRGASVVGIDLSAELIALAKAREQREPLGIEYRRVSASAIATEWPETFDIVTACMSLQDVADVDGAVSGAFEVLRADGRLVFSVPHPATDPMFREWARDDQGRKLYLKLDRYFDTGPAVCDWNMRRLSYHWRTPFWRRTLSEWTALITGAGFSIEALHEPRPTADQVSANPNLDDCARMPFFLIFETRKQADKEGVRM